MIKRIIVAGSRNYHNYQEAESYINFCICRIRKEYNLVFVSGGCRGADALGERWDYQSRGTASLIEYAKEFNKPIRIKKVSSYASSE